MFKNLDLMGCGYYSYRKAMVVTCRGCDEEQYVDVDVDDWGVMTWRCDCGEDNEIDTEPDPDEAYDRWRDEQIEGLLL